MFPYYLLFSSITIFYFFNNIKSFSIEQKKNNFFIFLLVLLGFFVGFRDLHVGVDTLQYSYHYDIVDYTTSLGFRHPEWGFFQIMFLSRYYLGFNFQTFLFFLGILNVFSITYCLRRYCVNIYIGIIIYLTIGLFAMNLSGMRQSLAMSICFLTLPLIENRKLLFFLIMVSFAYVIHNSAIIFLPIYFLWGREISRIQGFVFLTIILSLFAYRLYLNPLIELFSPDKYTNLDLNSNYNINVLVILVPFCFTFFSLLFLPLEQHNRFNKINSFFYIFSCFYIGFLILSINNNQIGRLSYYFALGNMICFPASLKTLYKDSHIYATVIGISVVLLLFLYFFISTPGGTLKIDHYNLFFM